MENVPIELVVVIAATIVWILAEVVSLQGEAKPRVILAVAAVAGIAGGQLFGLDKEAAIALALAIVAAVGINEAHLPVLTQIKQAIKGKSED